MLYEKKGIMKMDIDKLMERYSLTGTREDFLAAVQEYQADRNRPTPSEEQIVAQITGGLDLDQAVALGALRGGGVRSLHELARKVRHQAGRAAVTDLKPGPDQAAAARREVMRRRANLRRHVVTVGG